MFTQLQSQCCSRQGCKEPATTYTASLLKRRVTQIGNLCAKHANKSIEVASHASVPQYTQSTGEYVCADISFIGCCDRGSLFLLVTETGNALAIPSGPCEGYIALGRFGMNDDRLAAELPLALLSLVKTLNLSSGSIVISEIGAADQTIIYTTYYVLTTNPEVLLRVKTTDAISLALYGSLPIFVSKDALNKHHELEWPLFPWN